MLACLELGDEQVLSSLEQDVDVHGEILVRVRKHEEVEELAIVQEEESVERESLLLEVLVSFLLNDQIVFRQLRENFHAIFDHQVVHRVGISVRAPHDAAELRAGLDEVALLGSEDRREKT